MTNGSQQLNLEDERIAGNHLAAELHIVDLHEVGAPALRLLEGVEYQESTTLGHSLNLQHTRHHGLLREVTLEERLVGCNVLHTHDGVSAQRNHLIDELHGIAVGQEFANLVHIHYRLLVGIVDGCLDLVLTNLLTHQTGELIVDGMTRTSGYDAALDGFADESHIADDVEQLVACALIVPLQRLVLDVTQIGSIAMLYVEHVGQHIEALLSGLALVDHDGVIQIATLDEVGLKQGLDIANKHEGASTGNLGIISIRIIECGKLRADELRLERAHGCNREVLIGQNGDARTGVLILHLDLLTDDIKILRGVLLFQTDLLDFLHILDG